MRCNFTLFFAVLSAAAVYGITMSSKLFIRCDSHGTSAALQAILFVIATFSVCVCLYPEHNLHDPNYHFLGMVKAPAQYTGSPALLHNTSEPHIPVRQCDHKHIIYTR